MILPVFILAILAVQANAFYLQSVPRSWSMTSLSPSMSLLGFPYDNFYPSTDSIAKIIKDLDTVTSRAFIPTATSTGISYSSMLMDVKETDKNYEILIEMPGVKKEDIQLTQKHETLTISAEKKGMEKEEGDTFRRQERFFGSISRTMTLPDDADKDHIAAKYENGVLQLTIPRTKPLEIPPKTITIE